MTTNHYWPQAHAMDVMVDAYMRTGSKQYLNIYPLWWEGAPKFNFAGREEDPWWNGLLWHRFACLKALRIPSI